MCGRAEWGQMRSIPTARRKGPVIPDSILDQLLNGANAKTAFESNGVFDQLRTALAGRIVNAEMDHHLSGEE